MVRGGNEGIRGEKKKEVGGKEVGERGKGKKGE